MLWGKLGKLRDERNGARYTINGESIEVRAIRNKEKWEALDASRAKDAFEAELLKNDITGGKGLKQIKR